MGGVSDHPPKVQRAPTTVVGPAHLSLGPSSRGVQSSQRTADSSTESDSGEDMSQGSWQFYILLGNVILCAVLERAWFGDQQTRPINSKCRCTALEILHNISASFCSSGKLGLYDVLPTLHGSWK